jgi:hypothetical protein
MTRAGGCEGGRPGRSAHLADWPVRDGAFSGDLRPCRRAPRLSDRAKASRPRPPARSARVDPPDVRTPRGCVESGSARARPEPLTGGGPQVGHLPAALQPLLQARSPLSRLDGEPRAAHRTTRCRPRESSRGGRRPRRDRPRLAATLPGQSSRGAPASPLPHLAAAAVSDMPGRAQPRRHGRDRGGGLTPATTSSSTRSSSSARRPRYAR